MSMMPGEGALKFRRSRLFSIMDVSQSNGRVTNAEDHCETASQLANYAEGVALHMDEAAAKARRFAADLRREYGIEKEGDT